MGLIRLSQDTSRWGDSCERGKKISGFIKRQDGLWTLECRYQWQIGKFLLGVNRIP